MKTDGKTLISNTAWSILNQGTRVATLAIVTIALSRHFGPQRFGTLAFGLAFVRIFAVIGAFGLDRILVRRLAETPQQSSEILRLAFRLKFVLALASYAALLGLVFLIDPHARLTVAIVALAGAGLLCQPFDVFDLHFQSENKFRLSFYGRTIPILFSTAVKVAVLFAGAPLLVFAGLETAEAIVIGAALWLLHRLCNREASFAPQPAPQINWSRLLGEGLPLLLASLAVMIYMRSDILMLGKMAGFEAAGIYSAAAQVTEGCALFPLAFAPALFPILVRWRKRGLRYYKQQFGRLFLGATLAGFAVSLFLTIAARPIVILLYGPQFLPAAKVLVIHGWATIFVFLGIVQSGYDITEGLTWAATQRAAIGAVTNIALNVVLIPKYGASGAAIATLISYGCSAFLLNLVRKATRPVFALQLRALLVFPLFVRRLRYE
jgi:PST family polysaccharide transporter